MKGQWFGLCYFPRSFMFTWTVCVLIVLAANVPHIQN
jgi:hypothetical protein